MSNVDFSNFDFSAFSPESEPDYEISLKQLRQDGEEAVLILNEIDELVAQQNELNARYNHIVQARMPHAMREIGIPSFELNDGSKIKLDSFFNGSISKAPDQEEAFRWVDNHGGDTLKKTVVEVKFGKGEANLAQDIFVSLQERDLNPTKKEDIHPQTLYSFLREKQAEYEKSLEDGRAAEEIPYDKLGVYHGVRAKITPKKGK